MKNLGLSILLILLSSINAQSQEFVTDTTANLSICLVPDAIPKYKGGYNQLVKLIKDNLTYTIDARKNQISGTIAVKFIVDTSGLVINPVLLNNLGYGLDEEVLRILGLMSGNWEPGYYEQEKVAQYITLPIQFSTYSKGISSQATDEIVVKESNELYLKGVTEFEAENYKEALELFNKAIEIDDYHLKAYYFRGRAHQRLGDLGNACLDWTHSHKRGIPESRKYVLEYCGNMQTVK